MPREDLLARTLVELADNLVDDFDVVELLTLLTTRCVEVLDVSAAGLLLVGPDGGLHVLASSSDTMRVVELFELQAQEGPCWDTLRSGEALVNQDLSHMNDLWPRFAPVAFEAGFRSAHALPMRLRGTVIGALNLFHTAHTDLTDADALAGQALADIATIAILQHQDALEARTVNGQLTSALNSRILIEQAKGILSARLDLSMDETFAALRRHSQNHNQRLSLVAEQIVNGTLSHTALRLQPQN
jgi:hypothetical protein